MRKKKRWRETLIIIVHKLVHRQEPYAIRLHSLLLPFSYPNVCKTRLSGQLFLLHSQLPWHEDLWISPLVSVSHWLHRRFYVIGRSHYPGRPTFRMKLAKLLGCKPAHSRRRHTAFGSQAVAHPKRVPLALHPHPPRPPHWNKCISESANAQGACGRGTSLFPTRSQKGTIFRIP